MMFWQIIVRILEIVRTKCAKCILKDDDDNPFTQPLRALQTVYTTTQKIQCISDTGRIQSSNHNLQNCHCLVSSLKPTLCLGKGLWSKGWKLGDSLTCKEQIVVLVLQSISADNEGMWCGGPLLKCLMFLLHTSPSIQVSCLLLKLLGMMS